MVTVGDWDTDKKCVSVFAELEALSQKRTFFFKETSEFPRHVPVSVCQSPSPCDPHDRLGEEEGEMYG